MTTENEIELKPCPFCQSDKLLMQQDAHYHVSCLNCQAKWGHPIKDIAVNAWNTRPMTAAEFIEQHLPGLLEKAREFEFDLLRAEDGYRQLHSEEILLSEARKLAGITPETKKPT